MYTKMFRALLGLVVLICLSLCQVTGALAGQTGVISGTVVNAATGSPIAGVSVTAVSPTGKYSTVTNSTGFYSFTGVSPDTYTVSFKADGYQSAVQGGVNVYADQTTPVNARLQKGITTLATIPVHGQAGAYQPSQTVDTYTVTSSTINNIQGNSVNISETNLISSLPGASVDSSGYPTIRGGRENEEGFEFEGIPFVDAFTNQFTNTLATPGLGLASAQLTPGAGNASFGNNGTGTLNLLAKKGSYPGYADVQTAVGGPNYFHGLNAEYGTADPNGRWSEYFAFAGQGTNYFYGGSHNANAAQLLVFRSVQFESDREFLNNFTYRFGHDLKQSVQLFYDDAQHDFIGGYGGNPYCFTTCDPRRLETFNGILALLGAPPMDPQQIGSIFQLDPYQISPTETLAQANRPPYTYFQPNHAMKLQFDDNINPSTYFSAKVYRTNAVTTFDFPEPDGFVLQQGGFTTGVTADYQSQLSDVHLIKLGADYSYLHPVYDQPSNYFAMLSYLLGGGDPLTGLGSWEFYDFLPANSPVCPVNCGYIRQFFPNGIKIPDNLEQSISNRQDMSLYLNDTWSPTSAIKIDTGVRMDGANYRLPAPGIDPSTCTSLYLPDPGSWKPSTTGGCPTATFNDISKAEIQPRIVEPRFAFSWQMNPSNDLRFSYGRSVEFPPLGQVDLYDPLSYFHQFANIPSFDWLGSALLGSPIPAQCGIPGYQVTCKNYADQLLWENQNTIEGVPLQPVKPETFNNYDLSFEHQFTGGFSAKLTPWFRRGYDATAAVQSVKIGPNGQPIRNPDGTYQFNPSVFTNLGVDRATGLELLVTKEGNYGLTGQFAATYINEFSNVIPLSGSEDFFPSIPPASLALGNLYRVGFISPFQTSVDLNYKTRNGWRVSPQFQWNIGYPLSAGTVAAAFVDGIPFNLINTNVTQGFNTAPNGSTQYVDPMNPGSVFNPNIAATRGTDEGVDPGSKLSHPSSNLNLTIEKNLANSQLLGVTVQNVFNELYSGATLNPHYQPVATGLAGPLTGINPVAYDPNYAGLGYSNFTGLIRGQNAYYNSPNNFGRTYYFYYQMKL